MSRDVWCPRGGPTRVSALRPTSRPGRLRCRAVTTCLFASAFAAVDTVSHLVGRVQRTTGALLEGSFNPVRLLIALAVSGAVCWGFLTLVDLSARRRSTGSQQRGDRRRARRAGLSSPIAH